MDHKPCPSCSKPEYPRYMTKGEGQLEQCLQTHIPTTTWTCECGYKEWESAVNTPWKTSVVRDSLTGERLTADRRTGEE